MSLCARAVALWLVACALAARARAERLQCTHPNCTWVETADKIYETYTINGADEILIKIKDRIQFFTSCRPSVPLDDPARPRFSNPETFEYVELYSCSPPKSISYAEALEALNVPVTRKFSLLAIPADAKISPASLADMSGLEELTLNARYDGPVFELDPGTLAGFEGLRSLQLQHVRADQLPKVSELYLRSVEILPPDAFDVVKLRITDDKITSINESVPQIKELVLWMPSLVSLVLYNISSHLRMEQLVRDCPALEVLELRYVNNSLPDDLLKNAASLKNFTFTYSINSTLPPSLFTDSPHLQIIDLSNNMLESLPRDLFSGLSELLALRLDDNRLSAKELRAVSPLVSLLALDASGNPLGDDLCSGEEASVLSQLQHLRELNLARTGSARVCTSWLAELHALKFLDLHGNHVQNISCEDLRKPLYPGTNFTVISIQDNPLEEFHCSLDDKSVVGDSKPRQIVLVNEAVEKCNCDCPFVKCIPDPTMAHDIILPDATVPDEATTVTSVPDEATTVATVPDEATTVASVPDEATTVASELDETTSAETTVD